MNTEIETTKDELCRLVRQLVSDKKIEFKSKVKLNTKRSVTPAGSYRNEKNIIQIEIACVYEVRSCMRRDTYFTMLLPLYLRITSSVIVREVT